MVLSFWCVFTNWFVLKDCRTIFSNMWMDSTGWSLLVSLARENIRYWNRVPSVFFFIQRISSHMKTLINQKIKLFLKYFFFIFQVVNGALSLVNDLCRLYEATMLRFVPAYVDHIVALISVSGCFNSPVICFWLIKTQHSFDCGLIGQSVLWLIDWSMKYIEIDWLIDWLIEYIEIHRLIDWLIEYIEIHRLIDRLIDWLSAL